MWVLWQALPMQWSDPTCFSPIGSCNTPFSNATPLHLKAFMNGISLFLLACPLTQLNGLMLLACWMGKRKFVFTKLGKRAFIPGLASLGCKSMKCLWTAKWWHADAASLLCSWFQEPQWWHWGWPVKKARSNLSLANRIECKEWQRGWVDWSRRHV